MTARWYRELGDGPPCPEPGHDHHLYHLERTTYNDGLQHLYWCPQSQALWATAPDWGLGECLSRGTLDDAVDSERKLSMEGPE